MKTDERTKFLYKSREKIFSSVSFACYTVIVVEKPTDQSEREERGEEEEEERELRERKKKERVGAALSLINENG